MAEGFPADLPPEVRRPARMKLVAGRRWVGLTVVLDGLHDPHNISAVLRSCDGFGVQRVHLIGDPADLPVNAQITRGCEKWLSLHYHAESAECASALRAEGFQLWAADPDRQATPLDEIDFSRKVALVFGAEHAGLSDELLSCCDGRYRIHMAGFSQSLNVSVAAAVSLYVATSARGRALGRHTDLEDAEIAALAHRWIEADAARRHSQ